MNFFSGFEKGMGIGGWMTNFKRLHVLAPEQQNVLTIGDFEHFASYITQEDVKRIASFGMDHIRMAFDQIVLEDAAHPFTYREEMLKIIDHFISWCEDAKLNVVLNLHKAEGMHCDTADLVSLTNDPQLQERFVQLWLMLEQRYHSKNIAFELMNEVKDTPVEWNQLAQRTIDAIRALNPSRKLIIGGAYWNSIDGLYHLDLRPDDNIMYSFHFYEPFEFTHQRGVLMQGPLFYNRNMEYPGDIQKYKDYQTCVNGSYNGCYDAYDRMDSRFLNDRLEKAAEYQRLHPQQKIYCGEFGTIRHCKIEYRENYMRDMIRFMQAHEIPYCVWNYLSTPNDGNRFSLVDDDNRHILSSRLLGILNGTMLQ